jgi:hypothetical protein
MVTPRFSKDIGELLRKDVDSRSSMLAAFCCNCPGALLMVHHVT